MKLIKYILFIFNFYNASTFAKGLTLFELENNLSSPNQASFIKRMHSPYRLINKIELKTGLSQSKSISYGSGTQNVTPTVITSTSNEETRTSINKSKEGVRNNISLRLSPKSYGEYALKSKLFTEQKKVLKQHINDNTTKVKVDFYKNFLQILYQKKLLNKFKKRENILNKKKNILKYKIKKKQIDVSSILNIDSEIAEVRVKQITTTENIKNATITLKALFNNNVDIKKISGKGIISLSNIKKNINNSKLFSQSNNTQIKSKFLKLKILDLEYKIEDNDKNRLINFIEFGHEKIKGKTLGSNNKIKLLNYSQDVDERGTTVSDVNNIDEKFSFNISFNIPFLSDRSSINSKIIRLASQRINHQNEKIKFRMLYEQTKNKLLNLLKLHKELSNSPQLRKSKKYLSLLEQSKSSSPLTKVNIRNEIIKRETQLKDIEFKIKFEYVNLIALAPPNIESGHILSNNSRSKK